MLQHGRKGGWNLCAYAQHTLGSHVGIYNYTNFGNLYTNGPKDFFVKK